ncbi:hypothetical protein E3N88_26621 [Mikania micrantha]|uniref:4Fe-4S ferredoxin-type domain-containing protein n=1 Tax=Mikania micrantha TaxID=192012 RepID=A0A5N6MVF4_9ASTR|nr:hypothetical protein E3N88_26621 [Mikania micrantha]
MEQLQASLVLCFLLAFIVGATPSPTSDASVLCISECGTCPLICSPPPRSIESKPPPSVEPKPPQSPTHGDSEPPPYLTPIYHTTPPQSYSPPSPTPTPPRTQAKSCPPPSYTTMSTNAPPPPPKLVVVPSTQIQPGDGIGQKNNSYPYYYFYASKGVAFSQEIPGLLILFTCFHFIFLLIG